MTLPPAALDVLSSHAAAICVRVRYSGTRRSRDLAAATEEGQAAELEVRTAYLYILTPS